MTDRLTEIRNRAGIYHESSDARWLLGEVERLTAERDRNKRACETLGHIVEQNGRMILDITGLHDWIDEDGDGDWGAVWDYAYELLPRAEAAEAHIARIRAVAHDSGPLGFTRRYHEALLSVIEGDA
jgi:hypothetical protein